MPRPHASAACARNTRPVFKPRIPAEAPRKSCWIGRSRAIRLAELEGLYQEAAAPGWNIPPDVQQIVESARRKIADAI
jgi:predicted DNA-binding protein (UPF0251 family)